MPLVCPLTIRQMVTLTLMQVKGDVGPTYKTHSVFFRHTCNTWSHGIRSRIHRTLDRRSTPVKLVQLLLKVFVNVRIGKPVFMIINNAKGEPYHVCTIEFSS